MAVKVHSISQGMVSCYAIEQDGVVLVDTGMPDQANKLLASLSALGIDPKDIRLILLTHGHFDHTGGLAVLRSVTGCPIAVHRDDRKMVEEPADEPVPLLKKSAWISVMTALIAAFSKITGPRETAAPAKVDLVIGDEPFSLKPYGVDGTVYHTPGHTPGSVSIVLDSGETFIGDTAVNGFPFRRGPGMSFVGYDAGLIEQSWQMLANKGAKTIYPAHGKPFDISVLVP